MFLRCVVTRPRREPPTSLRSGLVGRFHVKRKVSFRRWPHLLLLPSSLLPLPLSFSTRTRTEPERTEGRTDADALAAAAGVCRSELVCTRRFNAKSRAALENRAYCTNGRQVHPCNHAYQTSTPEPRTGIALSSVINYTIETYRALRLIRKSISHFCKRTGGQLGKRRKAQRPQSVMANWVCCGLRKSSCKHSTHYSPPPPPPPRRNH